MEKAIDWSVFETVKVGHVTDLENATGVTVVLFERGAVVGVEVRGGAPGVFGAETASPLHLTSSIHSVVFTGGSAFGLETVFGVIQWLERHGIGFDTNVTKVPIVIGGVVFDLRVGSAFVRPTKEWGYQACEMASPTEISQGNIGAGSGATVGKVAGFDYAMKGGLGIKFMELTNDVHIASLVVVNAWGDVVNWRTNEIIAGAYNRKTNEWLDAESYLLSGSKSIGFTPMPVGENTTLALVVTDAGLTKVQATKVAQWAQSGITVSIRPSQTMYDGDFSVVASVGNKLCEFHALCVAVRHTVADAVVNAVSNSKPLHGIPSASSVKK